MSNTLRFLWFPAVIVAAVFLSRRWPEAMRRGLAPPGRHQRCRPPLHHRDRLATADRAGAAIHRWLPHGLFISGLDRDSVRHRRGFGPLSHVPLPRGAGLALLVFLAVLFLASITGYLGPSHVPCSTL